MSVALLMVAAVAMLVATTSYLRVVHRWDRLSALLGASPGSMVQVIALSTELGADLRAIAIVQTVRVLLLTVGIPGGLALFGLVAPAMPVVRGAAATSSLGELAIVVAVSSATALATARLRFPGGLLFGAMAGSGVLHGTGLVIAVLPWWIGAAAVLAVSYTHLDVYKRQTATWNCRGNKIMANSDSTVMARKFATGGVLVSTAAVCGCRSALANSATGP